MLKKYIKQDKCQLKFSNVNVDLDLVKDLIEFFVVNPVLSDLATTETEL